MSPRSGGRSWPRGERADEPEVLGSVLQSLARGRPWSSGLSLGELGRRWERVVGERLAAECRPASLDGGVLVVRASSAAWAAQIRFLAEDVRRRANEALGTDLVREVKVVVGGD